MSTHQPRSRLPSSLEKKKKNVSHTNSSTWVSSSCDRSEGRNGRPRRSIHAIWLPFYYPKSIQRMRKKMEGDPYNPPWFPLRESPNGSFPIPAVIPFSHHGRTRLDDSMSSPGASSRSVRPGNACSVWEELLIETHQNVLKSRRNAFLLPVTRSEVSATCDLGLFTQPSRLAFGRSDRPAFFQLMLDTLHASSLLSMASSTFSLAPLAFVRHFAPKLTGMCTVNDWLPDINIRSQHECRAICHNSKG